MFIERDSLQTNLLQREQRLNSISDKQRGKISSHNITLFYFNYPLIL